MLSTPPEQWDARVPADRQARHHFRGRTFTFDGLVALRAGENLASQITPQRWRERHAACQRAIARLADVFHSAKPDVAVIVGNDQMEVFSDKNLPAFAVFRGDTVENIPLTEAQLARLPAGIAIAEPGHMTPTRTAYRTLPELGEHIARTLIAEAFDVAVSKELPAGPLGSNSIPHAFGFIYRNVMRDAVIPHVPVMVNTFYPPNQPSAARCAGFGRALLRAIAGWQTDKTVALICSGGLSHFAIAARDVSRVVDLPETYFQAGSSEIKNWIPVIGAMAELGLAPNVVDYVPCYRSEAGTGNAMGFVYWQ
jgi:3-O-methylgallate 3,4-dioxygenase